MQVVCGNCQLSFQAPDGATGLVCPICRSPLRAADAPTETTMGTTPQIVDWTGGTLDDLVSLLSGPAWSARVEVMSPSGSNAVGEVHVIAGGVSEAIYESKSTHDALDKLRAVKSTRFRVEPRLPNPSDGDLTFPGPEQGKLEERPLAHLMRYCEDYVLTAGIEVWRGSENSKVDYRRGEIVGVTVGGIDAPERLAEVMKWSSGSYRLIVPKLTLPATAPKAAAPATVVAPRSVAAAGKTIFGMPALDPAALAAASEKVKASQTHPQAAATTTAPAPTVPRASSPAVPGTPARPAAAPNPPTEAAAPPENKAASAAAAATPTVPKQSAAAKTIIGIQGPAPTAGPPADAPATAGQAAAAAARAATPAPQAAESAKPGKPAPTQPSAAATRAAQPAVAVSATAEIDRTAPTKTPKQKPSETPVWTYVGVGFVFGLALLGVYRLVIVLAH